MNLLAVVVVMFYRNLIGKPFYPGTVRATFSPDGEEQLQDLTSVSPLYTDFFLTRAKIWEAFTLV